MLNTKYIIFSQEGVKDIYQNDFSSGSAWFVKENINVPDDDYEIKSLDTLNFKEVSISQSFKTKKYQNEISQIVLVEKKSDYIKYNVTTDDLSLIIFSEIFYSKGWKSYVDGNEVSIERFNYILRGLEVPRGDYEVEFVFEPQIVKISSNISLFSTEEKKEKYARFLAFLMIGFFIVNHTLLFSLGKWELSKELPWVI